MRSYNLEAFVRLRLELTNEKAAIENRLRQINEALGHGTIATYPSQSTNANPSSASGRGRRASGSGTSLQAHVLAVLQAGPKTKEEVLEAVQRRGYKFKTNKPVNSLAGILYGKKPKLTRANGKFSLSGGSTKLGNQASFNLSPSAKSSSGKRQMSEAGMKAIADAARKRWAAAKRAGKNRL